MFILTSQLQDKNADICIEGYPFIIGRKEPCFEKIKLHFPHIADLLSFLSKQHASFDLDHHQLTIVDLGSMNGTKVNGHPISNQKVFLLHGDRVSFAEQLHYTLIDTEHREDIPHITLEPVNKQLALPAISIEQSSVIIGRDNQDFANIPEPIKDAIQNISRQHCKIQWKDDKLFIIDLGSTNGTYVDDRLIAGYQSVFLKNGMTVSFSPELKYQVRIAFPGNTLQYSENTMQILSNSEGIAEDNINDPESELNKNTVYMKDATSFLSMISSEASEEIDENVDTTDKEKKHWLSEKPIYWIKKFSTKIILVSICVVTITTLSIYLYNQSETRQLSELYNSGQYRQAANQAQEILSRKNGHREAQGLLFQSIAREYLIDWAVNISQENPGEARKTLDGVRLFADNNQEISSLLRFVLLMTDLAENIPVSSLDQLELDINLTDRYKKLYQEWNHSKLDNRAFLERLLQVDRIFTEIEEPLYRKLNFLEILVSQHLKGAAGLQKDIAFYLISSQPEKIAALLGNFAQKYPNVKGIESFRSDLKAYLEITRLIQRHDSAALLNKTSLFLPATPPFREHLPNLLLAIPDREELQAFAEAEFAWQQGEVDQAITMLQQATAGVWSEYSRNRIIHFQKINDLYKELHEPSNSPDYFKRLIEFRKILADNDSYFNNFVEERLSSTSNQHKNYATTLVNQSMKHWDEYINSGGISPSMRMDPAISDLYRNQSMHLSKAYGFYQEALQLVETYDLSFGPEFYNHGNELQNEVLIQQKRMQSLRNIISKDIFNEKTSLLPE